MRRGFAGIAAALLLVLPPMGAGRAEDDAALRAELLMSMRQRYSDAGPGAPTLLDLLSDRFPADLDALMDTVVAAHKARRPPDEVEAAAARTFVAIQTRDGDRILSAPDADLMAVVEAHAGIVRMLHDADPALCKALVEQGAAIVPPPPAIGRLYITRLRHILTAIADGRDRPVPARTMQGRDYLDFALEARRRGAVPDPTTWAIAITEGALSRADPVQICLMLESYYDMALAIDGGLGERIRAALAQELLVTDIDSYRSAPAP
ncbi:hypothetical protein P409_11050 [Inquilinus limosus MP06]|uniref:DUF2059 domain-containing protein n=2 Tax=Inquilinus limosus TaxID=171674 RepID=A0A0A0DBB6_9PROT|nr:hypothetical protein P409_11050 [Inquilinus limosus MP06]